MPTLTEAEMLEAIENGTIRGITLDTNVFHRQDYNLQAPTLKKLVVFPLHGIEVIFADFIAAEVKSHLSEQLDSAHTALDSALKEYTKKWRLDFAARDEVIKISQLGRDTEKTASDYWDAFMKGLKGIPVSADDNVSIAEITRMYFSATAPFEEKADKKSEFPDAIALLSLEGWAKAKGCLVLAVSHDKGWKAYGENSKSVVVIDDIHKAYSAINQSVQSLASKVVDQLASGKAPNLDGRISDAIQSRLDDLDFDVEAESYLSVQGTPESAVVEKVNYFANPSVLDYDDDTVTLAFIVTASIEVSAEFVLSVRDDGEDHPLDSTSETISRDIEFEVVLTLPKGTADDPDVIDLELNRARLSFNFGYLTPFEREAREYLESQHE